MERTRLNATISFDAECTRVDEQTISTDLSVSSLNRLTLFPTVYAIPIRDEERNNASATATARARNYHRRNSLRLRPIPPVPREWLVEHPPRRVIDSR